MQDISKFIVDNWQSLFTAFCSLLAVILVCIRKKPVVQSLQQAVDYVISFVMPGFILAAEKTSNTGEIKKQIVVNHCLAYLGSMIKLDDDGMVVAVKLFGEAIERFLATPQKKG